MFPFGFSARMGPDCWLCRKGGGNFIKKVVSERKGRVENGTKREEKGNYSILAM